MNWVRITTRPSASPIVEVYRRQRLRAAYRTLRKAGFSSWMARKLVSDLILGGRAEVRS